MSLRILSPAKECYKLYVYTYNIYIYTHTHTLIFAHWTWKAWVCALHLLYIKKVLGTSYDIVAQGGIDPKLPLFVGS